MAAVTGGLALTGISGAYAETVAPVSPAGPQVHEGALKAMLDASGGSTPGSNAKMASPLAASALSTVDAFIAQWNNKYVDADGYYGAQCWDLWEQYCRSVIGCAGISTQYSPNPGYASGLWDGYARNGAAQYFTQISATSVPQKGDVAIWKYGQYPNYPYSHTAIVIADAGSYVNVLSQNSSPSLPNNPYPGQSTGPSVKQNLPKAGLAGYFRPKSSNAGQPTTPPPVAPPPTTAQPSAAPPVTAQPQPRIGSQADILAVDNAGVLWIYPATGRGGLDSRAKVEGDWAGMVTGWTVDWTGNGILDLVVKWNDGQIRLYPGRAQGGFDAPQVIGTGWGSIDIAPARWRSSDMLPGLMAKLANGDLRYYPNSQGGAMSSWVKVGHGWNGMTINVLNFNADSHADVIAQDPGGLLWLYPGTGAGTFGTKSRVGNGFNKTGLMATAGFNGAASKGLILRTSASTLTYYPLTAAGQFQTPFMISNSFSNMRLLNTQ
ncbi:MAG: CHAP domain-containing protein [Specibacter sp.]